MEKEEIQVENTNVQETEPKSESIFQDGGKYLTKEEVNTLMEKKIHLTQQSYDDIPT